MSRIRKSILVVCGLLILCYACTPDSWDEHYKDDPAIATGKVLWDILAEQDQLSDFREVLDSVKVMNGRKRSSVSYADLLRQQFFTVFAPINGTFNKDSLLALCTTTEGNELVGKRFVMSHLSRRPYSVATGALEVKALMFNGKYLLFANGTLSGIPLIGDKSNLVARNGIVHCIERAVPYYVNLYEFLLDGTEYADMGQFLRTYEKDSLDEYASVPAGLGQDGLLEYVDSVMIEKNELLNYFGLINSEDSSYHMVFPSKAGWDEAYAKVSKYFNFVGIPGADSLKRYWSHYTVMRDLFFNWNEQESPEDSLITTQYVYNARNPKLHVYHKPFDVGGILHNAAQRTVSNGVVYQVDKWPYDIEQVFFTPIVVEAEDPDVYKDHNKVTGTYVYRQKYADSISGSGYMYLSELAASSQPDVTFKIPNTLSGKYDVCLVLLPVSVFAPQEKNVYPNRVSASITYTQANGQSRTVDCIDPVTGLTYYVNDPYRVDTLTLTTITFPTCNYDQKDVTVFLKVKSAKRTQDVRFLHKMGIDCICLKPRQD